MKSTFIAALDLRFHTLQWTKIVDTLMAAVDATDPGRPMFRTKPAISHVPELEVLIYAVTKNAKFGDALHRAVELHRSTERTTECRMMASFRCR